MLLRIILAVVAVALAPGNSPAAENAPLTFLDTLNKGKELSIVVPETAKQAEVPTDRAAASGSERTYDAEPVLEQQRIDGTVPSRFMVQILASTQEQQVKQERRNVVSKVKLPASITFDAPYYKLMVGDFSGRIEAESALAELRKLGYNDAWIVRTAARPKR